MLDVLINLFTESGLMLDLAAAIGITALFYTILKEDAGK